MNSNRSHRSAIAAIARFENDFIEEWVNYHLIVGFEHIFIYDNAEPGEENLDFLREKYQYQVTIIRMPGRYMQGTAYSHYVANFSSNVEWTAFIDIDEFFVFHQDNTFENFIQKYGHLGCIAVSWLSFGHSGHRSRPEGLVVDDYVWRYPVYLPQFKSICRSSQIDVIKSVHNINGKARLVTGHDLRGESKLGGSDGPPYSEELDTTEIVSLNHYFTRSLEDLETKASRGSAAGTVPGRREFDWYFNAASTFNFTLDLRAANMLRKLANGRRDGGGDYLREKLSKRRSVTLPEDFDAEWYADFYPDLKASNALALTSSEHFQRHGAFEGRAWSKTRWDLQYFDPQHYLNANPDLVRNGIRLATAKYHYVVSGITYGRKIF